MSIKTYAWDEIKEVAEFLNKKTNISEMFEPCSESEDGHDAAIHLASSIMQGSNTACYICHGTGIQPKDEHIHTMYRLRFPERAK